MCPSLLQTCCKACLYQSVGHWTNISTCVNPGTPTEPASKLLLGWLRGWHALRGEDIPVGGAAQGVEWSLDAAVSMAISIWVAAGGSDLLLQFYGHRSEQPYQAAYDLLQGKGMFVLLPCAQLLPPPNLVGKQWRPAGLLAPAHVGIVLSICMHM